VRVFLDANVLFSAGNSGSNIARLIHLLIERGTAVTSDFALEEAGRNVELKRPAWQDSFRQISARVEVVPSALFKLPVELTEKDVPILCAAIRASCDALATGDKRHFGHLYGQAVDSVRIVSLVQLAQLLAEGESESTAG
jgi:predicted nucleic acid-binding protein